MNSPQLEQQINFRELRGIEEMVIAEALQKTVWESALDYDHKDIMIAIQHAGGLVAGAFIQDETMVGFILALPTMQAHGLHSHRLAVLPGYRRYHIGEKLKWFQHAWALEHNIKVIHWTFDPLLINNAHLNIHKLGAVVNTYYENFYGSMDGINCGTPSDRILAVWHLNSSRVIACRDNIDWGNPSVKDVAANSRSCNIPSEEYLDLTDRSIRINLPININELVSTDRNLAIEWRLHIRRLLENYFSHGYWISNFTKSDGPAYILQHYSDLAASLKNP